MTLIVCILKPSSVTILKTNLASNAAVLPCQERKLLMEEWFYMPVLYQKVGD